MAGFQSPNYTQTPNDLFDTLMHDMDLAELKVVLAVIRGTLGWHRDSFQMSVRKIASLTGLSSPSVQTGAKKAEEHGLIERVGDGKHSTYWRAIINVPESVSESNTVSEEVYQNITQSVSNSDTQLGLKKGKKTRLNKDSRTDHPAILCIRGLVGKYPPKELYDDAIKILGDSPDGEKLAACRKEWLQRGYNPNAWTWLTEWYQNGTGKTTRRKVESGHTTLEGV